MHSKRELIKYNTSQLLIILLSNFRQFFSSLNFFFFFFSKTIETSRSYFVIITIATFEEPKLKSKPKLKLKPKPKANLNGAEKSVLQFKRKTRETCVESVQPKLLYD